MTDSSPAVAIDHPYAAAIDREHERFDELLMLIAGLEEDQRSGPAISTTATGPSRTWSPISERGWQRRKSSSFRSRRGPTWTSRWTSTASMRGSWQALRDQPWSICWNQLLSARARMLSVWAGLKERTEPADRWVRKAGADHLDEHLPRLRAWVAELRGQRVPG